MSDQRPLDIPTLVGITGWGARAVLVLFIVVYIVITALAGGAPMASWPGWLTLALVFAAAALEVVPGQNPFPIPRALFVVAVVLLTIVTITWPQSPATNPGYEMWNWGADSFLLFGLALRGRIVLAWIGAGATTALVAAWSWSAVGNPLPGLGLFYSQLAALFAGTFFAYGLRRTAQRILDFQAVERRRESEERARDARAEQRTREVARIRELAGPALEVIAAGHSTAAQREEHRLLEAQLRDDIRGRSLAVEPLTGAARSARSRGIDVIMLDDTGWPPGAEPAVAAAQWAAARVASTTAASAITVRLTAEPGRAVVTVATDSEAVSHTILRPESSGAVVAPVQIIPVSR